MTHAWPNFLTQVKKLSSSKIPKCLHKWLNKLRLHWKYFNKMHFIEYRHHAAKMDCNIQFSFIRGFSLWRIIGVFIIFKYIGSPCHHFPWYFEFNHFKENVVCCVAVNILDSNQFDVLFVFDCLPPRSLLHSSPQHKCTVGGDFVKYFGW